MTASKVKSAVYETWRELAAVAPLEGWITELYDEEVIGWIAKAMGVGNVDDLLFNHGLDANDDEEWNDDD